MNEGDLTLGSLGSLSDPETGIPYKTKQVVAPLSDSSNYLYGTSAMPSQRFILKQLATDSEGNPQKLFESWHNLSEVDKNFVQQADQRREELTPEEISTLDMLKEGVQGFGTPVIQTFATEMIAGEPAKEAIKTALPFISSQKDLAQDLAKATPHGYRIDPQIDATLQADPAQAQRMIASGSAQRVVDPTSKKTYFAVDSTVSPSSISASVATASPDLHRGYDAASSASTSSVASDASKTLYGQKAIEGSPDFWSKEAFKTRGETAFQPTNLATNFAVDFGLRFALGRGKPKERAVQSAKGAAGATIGGAIGQTLGGPIGAFIGSSIGGSLAGRVICTELYRQNLVSREDYLMDLKFTQTHMIPKYGEVVLHGYWAWAIPQVKKMRTSKRRTMFWKHINSYRLLDMKWRLGKGKFSLIGRIYSLIGENLCWMIGSIADKEYDYNSLYKENTNGK